MLIFLLIIDINQIMIISRTPLRISFFGGGTDYKQWYNQNGGSVISTSIDKYNYINVRYLPPFFKYKNSHFTHKGRQRRFL